MVFIVSNQKNKNPFKKYSRRWFIENMFGKFKTHGFNLESTHLTNTLRLSNLMLLISIAYVCCCKIGCIVHSCIKPIKFKKFSNNGEIQNRLQFNIFKLGFELLKNFLNNHLSAGVTMAKLFQQILDSQNIKLKFNRRSKAYQTLENFQ